jgi:hypothetical protein
MDLIKRLGIIVGIFVLCLLIRTLVSPPVVIVGELMKLLETNHITGCFLKLVDVEYLKKFVTKTLPD